MMHFSSGIGLKKQFKKSKSVADNQPFANVCSGPTGIGLQSSLGQKSLSQAPRQTHVTTKFNQSKNQTTPVRQQKIDLTASFSNASAHLKNKAHHLPKRASIFSSNGNRSCKSVIKGRTNGCENMFLVFFFKFLWKFRQNPENLFQRVRNPVQKGIKCHLKRTWTIVRFTVRRALKCLGHNL